MQSEMQQISLSLLPFTGSVITKYYNFYIIWFLLS